VVLRSVHSHHYTTRTVFPLSHCKNNVNAYPHINVSIGYTLLQSTAVKLQASYLDLSNNSRHCNGKFTIACNFHISS